MSRGLRARLASGVGDGLAPVLLARPASLG